MQNHNTYKLEKSPLYKLSNKRKICDLFGTSYSEMKDILKKKENYKVYTIKDKKGKNRKICEPKKRLKLIQKRIQRLLSRISTPDYLFSGKKGICYVDNANHHINAKYIINIDIRSFYPSCKREYIFRLFYYKFHMSEDVAWFITDLVTFDNSLPIGSPTSQLLAFFAYEDMFNEIYKYSIRNGLKLSVFVDDISFSSVKYISKILPYNIKQIVIKFEHTIKEDKTKIYFPSKHKRVTGCIISPESELKVPNRLRKEIIDKIKIIKTQDKKNPKMVYSLLGKIQSAKQIEPIIFDNIKSYLIGLKIPRPY